jgi:uncharacterized BrkB/YihY/UPF0761 family membrane protein
MDTTGKLGRGDKRLLSYSVRLLKTTFRHWLEDKAPQLGAALAYYTVFSLAPMVLVESISNRGLGRAEAVSIG